MRRVLLIGIGAGDPELLTLQAVAALKQADVVFAFDKGEAREGEAGDELLAMRKALCERFAPDAELVAIDDPKRDAAQGYRSGVDAWHEARARLVRAAIAAHVADGGCGAFLVWGEPALYDSTLRVVERALGGAPFAATIDIVPGISSLQLLAAKHRICLNEVAEPVLITTGRRLALDGVAHGASVVVMLDGDLACRRFTGQGLEIFWGACLGTADEALVSGPLDDVIGEIETARASLKQRKGWVMDTYLLRRAHATQAKRAD